MTRPLKPKVGASGKAVTDLWLDMGINVLPQSFSNPQWLTEQKGARSYKDIAVGLTHCYELMATDRIKIHRKCTNFWREFRSYAYDDKGVPNDSRTITGLDAFQIRYYDC